MYIVLLGPPGSGKGTQGKILAQKMELSHLSTGDLFRKILEETDHPLFSQLQVAKEGKLVSDDVVNKVVDSGLKRPEYLLGAVLDGYPRTVAQAQALDQILAFMGKKVDIVIDFNVTMDVLLFRLLGRTICPGCKRIFHIKQGHKDCPDCRVMLIQREDDNEETIMKRFDEYKEKTAPLQHYYQDSSAAYISIVIGDATKTPQDIQDEVWDEMLKRNLI